ncbi:MAG: hypothetical protein ACI379_04145 [Nocardioides sp.]|uniref:hypothetical protein n=1 Tax=Nocardioides sp. TaxID=35761 RepID=UPI003EFF3C5A
MEPPAATLARCARDLGELDLLCLIDAARSSGAWQPELNPSGLWGSAALRRVVPYSDWRAESIWEVLLRHFHTVVDAEVVPQYVVRDEFGRVIARSDLWLVGTQRLPEFDGGMHREPLQHAADLRRDRRLAAAGWIRHGYTSGDLLHRPLSILEDVDRALGRTHDPRRVREWNDLLRQSAFTPQGREALAKRLMR